MEHFKPGTHMRSTYPWGYLAGMLGMITVTAFLAEVGWWDGWLGYISMGATLTTAMDFGQERYRYRRYEKLGWG